RTGARPSGTPSTTSSAWRGASGRSGSSPSCGRKRRNTHMAIKVGDTLPDGTLTELIEDERPGCTIGPNAFKVSDLVKGKRIVIFGVPGAFTPTCSIKHLPSYTANYDKLKAKNVDEVWCFAANDAFVMGAWGKEQKA